MPRQQSSFVAILAALGVLGTALASAGEPTLSNLNIRGLQIGSTTSLVVSGDEFGAAPRLLLPFPGKQELQPGATNNQATFNVTPEGEIQPGYYQVRVVTSGGVSLPIVIGLAAVLLVRTARLEAVRPASVKYSPVVTLLKGGAAAAPKTKLVAVLFAV